ncbi:hypothetical protein NPX13_g5169 [Xylaria arbuscula]|uniref:Uncharacterized protein n=1 Tax=Xylaria arbuscula TaxID=114810 RepID=A0A9W8NF19_9PEZI|nr:hypothetical protein NPX13_g5169 [Xylaria arbuscula]
MRRVSEEPEGDGGSSWGNNQTWNQSALGLNTPVPTALPWTVYAPLARRAQGSHICVTNSTSQTGNDGDPHGVKTYLRKCGIWESGFALSSGGAYTDVDADVFDLLTRGTNVSDTSIDGFTLEYRPAICRYDVEAYVNMKGGRNATTRLFKCGLWESGEVLSSGSSHEPFEVERDMFDLITNGTEPYDTSIYGYTYKE